MTPNDIQLVRRVLRAEGIAENELNAHIEADFGSTHICEMYRQVPAADIKRAMQTYRICAVMGRQQKAAP